MARRIYVLLIIAALLMGIYLYSVKEMQSNNFLIGMATFLFMLFSMGVHGFLAHSLKPSTKGGIIIYPVLMGVLYGLMFFLFVFFILPVFCNEYPKVL
ncbi:hypothetical protein DNU06_06770 [Putridiphycobacter roseus]|uniref:Uncharacterized protein n=1 Tax=Putridiphycobacter roseus TaxID=2219161 RepID=A0A2W1NDM6_9FLAO|nr:hypothetical protein [Putridiphycobacter roseus]PZE17525.1 hypothetical protein DNU06_06770 [Putridiphycobacter roseus]